MSDNVSQSALILEYFKEHPKRVIPHAEVVDWSTKEWNSRTGQILRDPDRAIRKMHQQGLLVKVSKGQYMYDPDYVIKRELEDFSQSQKQTILERDGFKCVICGRGRENGVELQVDHVKPKEHNGKATVENGQTLCAQHNFQKKTYGQTEMGKKMFLHLLSNAKSEGDKELISFCEDILLTYEKHNVDGHIG